MLPKPKHLGPEYAAQFADRSVVAAYRHRPHYPAEVFEVLAGLIAATPHAARAVLDAGCGTGDLARHLVSQVDRLDAVDPSAAMVETGCRLPGGDDPRLRWIRGGIEEAPLDPPYALVTAGESLHWMDWAVALPRLRDALVPGGYLAIVGRGTPAPPWAGELQRLIDRYSTNRDYQPYDLIEELETRGFFQKAGEHRTAPVPFRQSIDDYVESIHSQNGFSRERMTARAAAEFDAAVGELVSRTYPDGMVEMQVASTIVWGWPCRADADAGDRAGSG